MTGVAAEQRQVEAVRLVARLLGTPLLPHQDDLVRRMCETSADGRYRYSSVCILWPRQTGKTTVLRSLALGRGLVLDDYRAAYTAQRGTTVTARFAGGGDGWIQQLDRSVLAGHYTHHRGAARERITCVRTGSYLRGFAPVDGALRGNALDLVMVDEAQEHDEVLGAALDATIVPTLATRPRRQYVVTGTAGVVGSWWHQRWVQAGGADGVLLHEMGSWPAGADPLDERVWREHHPGVRSGLTDVSQLRQAATILGDRFAREYGNRWDAAITATTVGDPAVDMSAWDACTDPSGQPLRTHQVDRLTLAVDVDPQRRMGVACLAGALPDGRVALEVGLAVPDPQHRQLLQWVLQVGRAQPALTGVVVDPSTCGALADDLDRELLPVQRLTRQQLARAWQDLTDLVGDRRLLHSGDLLLQRQLASAATRTATDGIQVLSRRHSTSPVCAVYAAAMAVHTALHLHVDQEPAVF